MQRPEIPRVSRAPSGRVIGWVFAIVGLLAVASLIFVIAFGRCYGPITGEDLLAKAGFESDSQVLAIEYCEDIPVFDLVDDPDPGAKTELVRLKTYRLTRPQDARLIDEVCTCLRHMSRTKGRPGCWVPASVLVIEDSKARQRHIPLVKMPDDEIVYAEMCDLYSPQLYRRLKLIVREEIGTREKAWKVRTGD